jgi:hypothetical protein
VQLYRYFVSQSSEFCRHNPLCCFSMSNIKGKHVFRYRFSPETFGYTLVYICKGRWTHIYAWMYLPVKSKHTERKKTLIRQERYKYAKRCSSISKGYDPFNGRCWWLGPQVMRGTFSLYQEFITNWRSRVLVEKKQRKHRHSIESEYSLSCSEEPNTGPCSNPLESSTHHHTPYSFIIRFNITNVHRKGTNF